MRVLNLILLGVVLSFGSSRTDAQLFPALEPLGQSSRRTSMVISEIMYNPASRADGRNLEFVELFNALITPEDISGWRLDGAADFVFPPGTIVPGGGFVVVAQAPADLAAVYGLSGVLGPFSNINSLPNARGTVQLRNRIGAVFLEATYDSEAPWPAAADGAGHSLVLGRPSYGEGQAMAWAASDAVGGSPGRMDPVTVDPLRNLVINEFLAHTDDPEPDFIELYNHSNQPLDISGCYLSDAPDTNKFTIPPGTILAPRGFIVFTQTQLGFALSSGGETIYLRDPARTRVLDAVRFAGQANGVSSGRYPDGGPGFSELEAKTAGEPNRAFLVRAIVINEIMYHPISGDSDDEFIELHNRGNTAASLGAWRLTGGISYTLPANATLPAGGYLVIARSATRIRERYPNLAASIVLGDYEGSLADGGERIALAMPDPVLTTNNNSVVTNFNFIVVDEVAYRDGGRWGRWSDGGGSSLELIDARSDNRLAANWADSDETAKAPWTAVSVPGVLDNGTSAADQLQVLLQGAGECLIDNVEVITGAGATLIANSTFEGGANGWTAEGTEALSGLETAEGFNSARSYRVRASDRGDNQVNRIRTPLTAAQPAGSTNIIRARVRWLRGHPEILFRLRGNWLEAAVAMDLPAQPGTPGARNSRAVANAPPAIYEVEHRPAVPAANQAVVVTARVHDPDGASIRLRYRIDPGANLNTITMLDNGTAGDAVAGDGLFAATIPGQAANTLVAFHVQGNDAGNPVATATSPDNAPARECLVRFGETVSAGSFPAYRFWMTQATFNAWDGRHNLNNTLNDVTFVLGNHRVIYNAGAVFAGSPYIAPGFNTPNGNRCGYSLEFPRDDLFLGDNALVLDWPGGHGRENTAIQEQMAYWIADQMDIAFSHRYFIRLTVNGVTDMQRGGVFEAVLQPGGEFLEQWSPGDSGGDFFKIDRAFEFDDNGGRIADPEPQLRLFTTPDLVHGGTKKKKETYRWRWLKRSFDSANDYTNLFVIADALNSAGPEPYTSQTEALADVEQWMAIFAIEHIINNFDSWGHDIGKNMYLYKPEQGRWQLYLFDLDWLMLVSPGGPGAYSASTGPLFSSDDPTVTRMYNHPPFRRAYFRAVERAVNTAFVAAKYESVMDAKYSSLRANGITLCDGQALADPSAVKTWFSQRRDYLRAQLNTVAANFAVTSNGGADFAANSNIVTLSGTAPVRVAGMRVNGIEHPVTWTGITSWSLRLSLDAGANSFALEGVDSAGNPLTTDTDRIGITYPGATESPVGQVVISEIMYHPAMPGAEFIEIHNASLTTAFDLSGWRLDPVDFAFAAGTILDPGAYLVVARDRDAFGAAYGGAVAVAGEFGRDLALTGATVRLVQPVPGPAPAAAVIVSTVAYERDLPWPGAADGGGASLQLIDARQPADRVANWGAASASTNSSVPLEWQTVTVTGTASSSRLYVYLNSAGDVYLDDLKLVAGTTPDIGVNMIINGDFESTFPGPWRVSANLAGSAPSTAVKFAGTRSLHVVATAAGTTLASSIWQDLTPLVMNAAYTLSYRYLPSPNGSGLTVRLSGNGILSSHGIGLAAAPSTRFTPGRRNSVAANLPPFPPVWLNEIQPVNVAGPRDQAGDRDPWLELYNSGTSSVSLDGWYLTDNFTNLTRWPFPAGTSIGPGGFLLVWLDGEPAESTAAGLHTPFRAPAANGAVALVFPLNARAAVLDYVKYAAPGADHTLGYFPDGQAGGREELILATPAGANDGRAAAPVIFINEWMASNTSASGFADPADSQFEDWLELYNPGNAAVDLAGYGLSDSLTNATGRWLIPAGTRIPAGGFLLVWADGEPEQNATNRAEIHANFRLSQDGEAIALYAPDGSLVDAVTFGAQTNDISQGRWPDGGTNLYFMPVSTPVGPNLGSTPPPPRILSVSLSLAGEVVITWSAVSGANYRVQAKDDLDAPAWIDVAEVTATGTTVSHAQPANGLPQRFYRILLR